MYRRLLFFTIAILIYMLHVTTWAQETGQSGGSISGALLMLDNKTPHVAVHIQAVRDGEVVASALSDEEGKYQFVGLEPGEYQVRCYTLNGYIYYRETMDGEPGMAGDDAATVVVGRSPLRNIDFRLAPFKKGTLWW